MVVGKYESDYVRTVKDSNLTESMLRNFKRGLLDGLVDETILLG